jgi:hypothetical protein
MQKALPFLSKLAGTTEHKNGKHEGCEDRHARVFSNSTERLQRQPRQRVLDFGQQETLGDGRSKGFYRIACISN